MMKYKVEEAFTPEELERKLNRYPEWWLEDIIPRSTNYVWVVLSRFEDTDEEESE